MNYKVVGGVIILITLVSFSLGRFTGPKKIETKTVEKVVYQDRIVTKEQRDVTKKVINTRSPDGTVRTETEIVDKSKTDTDSSHKITQEIVTETRIEARADWRVGVMYKPTLFGYQKPQYGFMLERRILGELYVGTLLSTDKTFGLLLSFGF